MGQKREMVIDTGNLWKDTKIDEYKGYLIITNPTDDMFTAINKEYSKYKMDEDKAK